MATDVIGRIQDYLKNPRQKVFKETDPLPPGSPSTPQKPIDVSRFLPFKFESPLPAMKEAYDRGGVPAVIGDRLRSGYEGAKDALTPTDGAFAGVVKEFNRGAVPNPKPASSPPVERPNDYSQSSIGDTTVTSKPIGAGGVPLENRTYSNAAGQASGIAKIGKRGTLSGAATDAEASRNLQARAEQDAAASQVAAGYDRAIERMRDVRAEKLGISRESLDQYEGRSQAPQAAPEQKQFNPFELPGDNRGAAQVRQQELISAATDPRAARKDRALAIQTLNSFLGRSAPAQQRQQQGVDPVDMSRFLLDQQKFGYQQQNDQQRLKLDMAGLENETAKTRLENQKYLGEERKAFMDNFSYPDENAPREQIGAGIWQMSQASGLPPETLMGYVQRAAEEAGVDWKNAPPKDVNQLLRKAMGLAAAENR